MTLRELCMTIRPSQKIRIKRTCIDDGILCLRYEALDENGLVPSVIDPAYLEWKVVLVMTDGRNDRSILINIREGL